MKDMDTVVSCLLGRKSQNGKERAAASCRCTADELQDAGFARSQYILQVQGLNFSGIMVAPAGSLFHTHMQVFIIHYGADQAGV